MSLDSALSVSSQNLSNIAQGFSVISQNVANAGTKGYATEQTTQVSLDANGQGFGALSGPTRLVSDAALQNQLYGQNAAAAAATTTQTALANLQPVLGTVGQGNDLGSLLGALQNGFSTLLADPSNQSQQGAVVSAAQTVAGQINTLSTAYTQARQSAQNGLVANVAQLNTALSTVGALSNQIIVLQQSGGTTADLQNQRNQALSSISGLVDARFAEQPNGDMLVFTAGGAQLSTRGNPVLSIAAATTGPTTAYPNNGLPGIMLGTTDVTGAMTGGAIGANLTLRDQTLPGYQAQLDEFSQTLTTRFSDQGLTLFSNPDGSIPAGQGSPNQASYIGYASTITVNPAVVATPSLVRDGTSTIAGSPTGAAAFTPNPNNLAGFTTLINNVLNYSFGNQIQSGVPQPAPYTTGLGPAGTLSAPYVPPATLADFATDVTGTVATDSNSATEAASEASGVQTTLSGNLASATGVDVDSQLSLMVQLQNAYGANAKIISAVQQMYTSLMAAVAVG